VGVSPVTDTGRANDVVGLNTHGARTSVQAMLDANDDAVMTYGELASVIRECRAAHFAAQPGGLSDVLRRVAQLLQQHHQDLAHLFHVIDRRDSGVLDYSQVGRTTPEGPRCMDSNSECAHTHGGVA
jgi:hypothetical protein